MRTHPWPSHSWQPPVDAAFLSEIRGPSGRSSRHRANRENLRQSLPLPARRPPGASSCRCTFHGDVLQGSPDDVPEIDIHSLSPRHEARHREPGRRPDSERLFADLRKTPLQGRRPASRESLLGPERWQPANHKPLTCPDSVAEVPLAGLSFLTTEKTDKGFRTLATTIRRFASQPWWGRGRPQRPCPACAS